MDDFSSDSGCYKQPPEGDVDSNGDLVEALVARIPEESTVSPFEQAELVARVVVHAWSRS